MLKKIETKARITQSHDNLRVNPSLQRLTRDFKPRATHSLPDLKTTHSSPDLKEYEIIDELETSSDKSSGRSIQSLFRRIRNQSRKHGLDDVINNVANDDINDDVINDDVINDDVINDGMCNDDVINDGMCNDMSNDTSNDTSSDINDSSDESPATLGSSADTTTYIDYEDERGRYDMHTANSNLTRSKTIGNRIRWGMYRNSSASRIKMAARMRVLAAEKNMIMRERDDAIRECDDAIRERDDAIRERHNTLRERDEAIRERDNTLHERDEAIRERDHAKIQRERAERQNKKTQKLLAYWFSQLHIEQRKVSDLQELLRKVSDP